VKLERLRPQSHRFEEALDSSAIGNHRSASEATHISESQLRATRMQIEHEVSMVR
jgi:hypothetical protein